METGKNSYRFLIVSGNEKSQDALINMLPKDNYESAVRAVSAAEARRTVLNQNIDIAILVAPLRDEFGTELALDLCEDDLGVLLIVPPESFDQTCYKVEDAGVVTLAKPLTRQTFYTAVRMITAMRGKMVRMQKKNQALQEKMQDIRIVNRAKWLLIEHMHITEQEAHYFIEKQAMDLRIARKAVAEGIIKNYEN